VFVKLQTQIRHPFLSPQKKKKKKEGRDFFLDLKREKNSTRRLPLPLSVCFHRKQEGKTK